MKNRIDELVLKLNIANTLYHTFDSPEMEDYEYDKLFKELIELESKYPELKRSDSPTLRIGGTILESLSKAEHKVPMMSLSNMFDINDLTAFYNRIKDVITEDISFVTEEKIDGLGISLVYEGGSLKEAVTRGDGMIGENVTNNVKTIKDIPLTLTKPIDITVRGELIIDSENFRLANIDRIKEEKQPFMNPRNAVAGTIRQLDSKVVAKRNISSFMYHIAESDLPEETTQVERLNYLEELGFKVNAERSLFKTVDELFNKVKEIELKRRNLGYGIDGVVIKLNESKYHNQLGSTSRVPRWASAYKFAPEETVTLLKDITYQVGRTGRITPVAELETVLLDGTNVSRATLHNQDNIVKKDIRIGDHVVVVKAGDIIPHVSKVDLTKPRGDKPFEMITHCPECNAELIKEFGKADWKCINLECGPQKVNKIVYFASRGAMNINGLGEKVVLDLFDNGFIRTPLDLYSLKDKRDELIIIPGYGEKSIDKLLEAIELSKSQSIIKLLNALGIHEWGTSNLTKLFEYYNSVDLIKDLVTNHQDKLIEVPGVGEIMAKLLTEWFTDEGNILLLGEFERLGFSMEEEISEVVVEDNIFKDKTLVITGSFEIDSRPALTEKLKGLGAKVTGSVSKNTDFLICGESAGSKLTKAQELGLRIIWEEELVEILGF